MINRTFNRRKRCLGKRKNTNLNSRLRRTKTNRVSIMNAMRTCASVFEPLRMTWFGVDSVI
jgi:hypothetical protein